MKESTKRNISTFIGCYNMSSAEKIKDYYVSGPIISFSFGGYRKEMALNLVANSYVWAKSWEQLSNLEPIYPTKEELEFMTAFLEKVEA